MSSPAPSVFFYISGHGFGHASRQIETINALGSLPGAPRIVVRTSAAARLFERTVRVPITFLPGECDTGVVQIDGLRLDEDATIARAAEFHRRLPDLARAEATLLRDHAARLVICDAPPLGCAAASAAGVPSVVLSNFTWDWIYEGYADRLDDAPDLLPRIREAYSGASAAWRLPLGGGFEQFRTVIDMPLIARHARHAPADVKRALGLPDSPLVLSSFGGFGVDGLDLGALDCLERYAVVITGSRMPPRLPRGMYFLEEQRIYDSGMRYEDVVAAADVVVTKPGYGIISECVANGTAMLYTSRGRFVEYDVMVREMPRILRCAYISHRDLFAGRWQSVLDAVLAQPEPPDHPPTNGAEVAAALMATEALFRGLI